MYAPREFIRDTLVALAVLGLALPGATSAAADSSNGSAWKTRWKNGISWRSDDGKDNLLQLRAQVDF